MGLLIEREESAGAVPTRTEPLAAMDVWAC
jgi:hypothetical protein